MRVLVLADSCNPKMTSTAFFGYQIVRALAGKVEQITLATHVRNQGSFTERDIGVDELVFLDNEYVAIPLHRLAARLKGHKEKAMTLSVAMQYPSNLAFEWEAWKRFGARLHRGEFDLVHRVTPLSPTLASPMAKWSPVPFVLGPINGGLRWPAGFQGELRREREWLTYVRGIHKILPYYHSTYQKSAAILAGFQHTIERLPEEVRPRIFNCPDVGYQEYPDVRPLERPPSESMTVLFVGRLVPYKCADVLVRAFAASPRLQRDRLVIVGDGPDRPLLNRLIAEHGLENCVELTGFLPHEEVMKRMQQADVFAFPSVRELGAGVVIEAMGMGLACVVADYGSPGAYVAGGRGIAIALTDKPSLIDGYVRALESLSTDPGKRTRLGAASQQYARATHTWDVKALKIVDVYEWVLGRRQEKPDFFDPLVRKTVIEPTRG
jgi:glycosyltransferase involved in cell wall biosynthesis